MPKETGIISKYQREMDLVVEWRISNFFTLLEEDPACYSSPDFCFGSERWRLWIFPNGSSESDSSGHLDLRLWKWSNGPSIRQFFSLSLKTAKGEKYHEKHYTRDFKMGLDCHAFDRFIPRSELTMRSSELMQEGALTVVCTMKSSPSAGNECEACPSGCSDNPHQNNLHYDLKQLFLQKEDCDVTIKVEGLEFPAHRVILKARSPVFTSTFRHEMKENATGILEIEDCDPSTFSDFLCFLYCGDVGIISQENVFCLFTAADKYQVLYLREKCLEFIKRNLTVDTFCETITLALRHSETELIKISTDYFIKNAPKIIVTVKWQTFLAENPTESNELLVKLLVPDSSSSK